MMPTGSDSGNSGSGTWKQYLNLSPDSGGQGQENSEAEPASRKRSADPREDVGPSSVRRRVDFLNAPGAGDHSGPSQSPSEENNKSKSPIYALAVNIKFTFVATRQNYGNQKRNGDRRATDILNLMVKYVFHLRKSIGLWPFFSLIYFFFILI